MDRQRFGLGPPALCVLPKLPEEVAMIRRHLNRDIDWKGMETHGPNVVQVRTDKLGQKASFCAI